MLSLIETVFFLCLVVQLGPGVLALAIQYFMLLTQNGSVSKLIFFLLC